MKFCKNCGTQLADDAVFCGNCGTKVDVEQITQEEKQQAPLENTDQQQETPVQEAGQEQQIQQQAPQQTPYGTPQQTPYGTPQQPKAPSPFVEKLKKVNKWVYIGAAAALAVIIAIIVIVCSLKNRIVLNDYITVKFDGYNTVGKATVDLDEDKLILDILKKNGIKLDTYDDISKLSGKKLIKAQKILQSVYNYNSKDDFKYELDKKENLCNGDKVTIAYYVNKNLAKDLGVKFVTKSKSFTVEGLKDAVTVNPFDYIELTYSGTAPNARASYKYKDNADDFIKTVGFSLNKSSEIKVGDTITVTLSCDKDYPIEHGYIFTTTSNDYTCDKLDEYISDITKLSDTQLKNIQKAATDYIESYFAGFSSNYNLKSSTLVYEGAYVLSAKSSYGGNKVYLIYSSEISASGSGYYKGFDATKIYFPVEFDDTISKVDGTLKYDTWLAIKGYTDLNLGFSSVKGYTDGAEMYKSLITANKGNYTYTINGNVSSFGN